MQQFQELYNSKLTTPDEAVSRCLHSGAVCASDIALAHSSLFYEAVGRAIAEGRLDDITQHTLLDTGAFPFYRPEFAGKYHGVSWFSQGPARKAINGGFADVIRLARGPVIASHSNCRALCDVRRNLTDDQLRAIRDTGGIVGLNVHHAFVHEDPAQQTAQMLARHAVHMAEVMGVEHVACGFDFCEFFGPGNDGAQGLEDCSGTGNLFFWLEKLGMSAREREMIARENFLRVLQ